MSSRGSVLSAATASADMLFEVSTAVEFDSDTETDSDWEEEAESDASAASDFVADAAATDAEAAIALLSVLSRLLTE